jgi:hypothetical protein
VKNKISLITNVEEIPLDLHVSAGNKHDTRILNGQLDNSNSIIDNIVQKDETIMLVDKGYDLEQIIIRVR